MNMAKEYTVYGIIYRGADDITCGAAVAAESGQEAESILEKAVVIGKGYEFMKGSLFSSSQDTGFKTDKKGVVFGYDSRSGSTLD
jgi:hypothetical protein